MKGILKIIVMTGSILCLMWGTVLTVMAWNSNAGGVSAPEMSVDPHRAVLATGLILLAGICTYFIRNKVKKI